MWSQFLLLFMCANIFFCFHAWMQFCGYISFVMCGSVVIVVLSLTRPWLYLPHIMVQHARVPSPASGPSSPSVSIWAKGGQLWGWSQMVLIKAILHANWTLTNEYPPFCNAKKSTSKTLVQKGCRAKYWQKLTMGGGGVQEPLILADVICEQPLNQ